MPTKPPTHHQRLLASGRVSKPEEHRGNAAARGYDAQWQRLRDLFIREHPCCALCGGAAVLVDHRIPISAGGARLDPSNLRSLCRECHDQVTLNYRMNGVNELPAKGGRP